MASRKQNDPAGQVQIPKCPRLLLTVGGNWSKGSHMNWLRILIVLAAAALIWLAGWWWL
jgi:hypothetical protein